MLMKLKHTRVRVLASFLVMLLALPPGIMAQQPAGSPAFKPEELEQLAAPIALYPDSLVAQILMASTYPLEVVQAERFAKQNKNLKGDALTKTLEAQKWDPSVKSLVNFPQVLTMMSEKLDWTQKLGDAFLAQQKDLMDTIQKLRVKAQAAGNLKTTKEQVARCLGLDPELLDRIHEVFLLSQKRIAELLRPVELLAHHRQHLRKIHQRLDAGVPSLRFEVLG